MAGCFVIIQVFGSKNSNAWQTNDYVAKMEAMMGHEQKPDFVVYYPRDFIVSYTSEARLYIKRSSSNYLEDKSHQCYTGHERSFIEVTLDFFLGTLEYVISDSAKEFTGTINDLGIKGVKELCALIESYAPDIDNKYRDDFIENARKHLLSNQNVKKVLTMYE